MWIKYSLHVYPLYVRQCDTFGWLGSSSARFIWRHERTVNDKSENKKSMKKIAVEIICRSYNSFAAINDPIQKISCYSYLIVMVWLLLLPVNLKRKIHDNCGITLGRRNWIFSLFRSTDTSSSISDLQEVTRRSGSVALTNLLGSSQSLLRQHGPTITNFLFLFSSFVIAIVCETGPKVVSLRFRCSAKQCCSSCYWLGRHGKKTSKEYICIYIPSWLGWMENNAELHWLARAPSVSTMPHHSIFKNAVL